jgi:hypothetical protein
VGRRRDAQGNGNHQSQRKGYANHPRIRGCPAPLPEVGHVRELA